MYEINLSTLGLIIIVTTLMIMQHNVWNGKENISSIHATVIRAEVMNIRKYVYIVLWINKLIVFWTSKIVLKRPIEKINTYCETNL
jgi:ABC-type branched-subunit amino acid transport system permease subunit